MIGCAGSPRRPLVDITSPEDLIGHVLNARNRVHDATAQASISIQIDGVRKNAKGVIFYRAPDSLRLEVSGPVGVSLMSALFFRDSVDVYLPRENQLISGPSSTVLRRVTGMELGYYRVPQALLGLPDLDENDLTHLTSFTTDTEAYRLVFGYPFGTRRITVDRFALGVLDDIVTDAHGVTLSHRTMSDYKRYGESYLPSRIAIEQDGNHLRIHHTRARPNLGVSSDQLHVRIPGTAKKTPTPSR